MAGGDGYKVTNEIMCVDEAGQWQFLRRSLVAGAHKYDARHPQVLPARMIEYFRLFIGFVTRLVCIGYGMGDIHINLILREWLEFSADRKLVIVGPDVTDVPPSWLLHVAPQVQAIRAGATDYLEQFAFEPLTEAERTLKHARQEILRCR